VTILAPGVTPAGLGTAAVQPDGSILFTPGAGVGTASFKYTVRSSNPAVAGASNVSEVLVTLTEPAGGFLPLGTADSAFTVRNRSFAINVLGNDSGNGGTLNPASVQLVAGSVTGGTATVNADGTVQFVSGATLGNAFGFDYTVANTNGNRSAPVHATVRVVNEALTFNTVAPECRASTRRWRAAGTGATPGSTISWHRTTGLVGAAAPDATNLIQSVTVAANGTFAFDVTSPLTCTTRTTFVTEAGTRVNNIAVRQR
jgi:Bacterial Ig domain